MSTSSKNNLLTNTTNSSVLAQVKGHKSRNVRYEKVEDPEAGGSGLLSDVYLYNKITTTNSKETSEKVAIKMDKPERKESSAQANEASFFKLMKRKLNDSAFEYIVRYHGKEIIGGEPCLVLEYLEGGDTGKYKFKSKGKHEDKEKLVRLWIRDILVALTILHSVNILHRDIKPANFVLSGVKGGHAKLADFGSAAKLEGSNKTTISRGSYEYRSPEGHLGNYVTEKADIFAVGLSVYELLTGAQAFPRLPGETKRVMLLDRIRDVDPDYACAEFKAISSEGQAFIKRLLVKDPLKRPNAVSALQDNWFKSAGVEPIAKAGDTWWLRNAGKAQAPNAGTSSSSSLAQDVAKVGKNSKRERTPPKNEKKRQKKGGDSLKGVDN